MNLGIEIGGTKLQLVLGDDNGGIIDRRRLKADREGAAEGIRHQIADAIREMCRARKLRSAGVGFGGPVNWRTGIICRSHQIEGWSDFNVGAWLGELVGAPVRVENDANVAALGEATRGAGCGANPVFFVTLGSGVGGGLVVDGHIYHGAIPGEAEIGHLRLDRFGTTIESRCSGWAVDARIRGLQTKDPSSLLHTLSLASQGAEARHLPAALSQGDAAALTILKETADDLAFGLSHVTHLLHPEVIVLGGGLSLVGEPLRAAVESALRPLIMDAFAPGPVVKLAALGEDSVPIGALELASRM